MKALVVGGSGGIGRALVENLAQRHSVEQLTATYHSRQPAFKNPGLRWIELDATCENSVASLAEATGELDLLINCAGILHKPERGPEKTIAQFDPEFFVESMRINTLPSLLLAKYFANSLKRSKHSVFAAVSARVGSIGENRLGGWYSYRSSKAALNMALRTLSIEWRLKLPNCCVAALHPGTTDTPLSRPFQRNVPPEKLFSPARAAVQLMAVIDSLSADKTGKFWSWDGEELPW